MLRHNMLSQGMDAANATLHRFLDSKDHFVHSAEAAGYDARVHLRDRLGRRRKRQLEQTREELRELRREAAGHHGKGRLAVLGLAAAAGYFIYQTFNRR